MVTLAIDMMGGDDAPGIVLEAVEKALNDSQIYILFCSEMKSSAILNIHA